MSARSKQKQKQSSTPFQDRCKTDFFSGYDDVSHPRSSAVQIQDDPFSTFSESAGYCEVLVSEPPLHVTALGTESCEEEISCSPFRSESEDQESSQSQESEDTCLEEKTVVPHLVAKLCSGTEPVCKSNQFLGPEGNVDIELIDKSANRYSVHFPVAGFYLWPATGLGFLVTAAVTVTITFDSWGRHLDLELQHHEKWMVAGPLFDISVEPEGVITEIHLPHVISLPANEVDISWFQVAHFKDEGMVLEPPARVEPFYAILENPSFSLMGILLRLARGTCLSVPITSTALIYYHFHPEDVKFHLYLIPSDSLLTKAIDEEEAKFQGVRLQTSPPVDPLNFGSRYIVSCSPSLEIIPKELKLSYRNPGEIQIFSKVYAGRMKEPIMLEITEKRHKTLIWCTLVKPEELQFGATSAPPPLPVVAFMKEHRRHLQARMGNLNGVLDDLQDCGVFTEEEKEMVQQMPTQQRRNETLLRMVENKGHQAQKVLLKSISRRDPYLMSYLNQQSLQQ
ncbi:caspase recruitment domain-containing protein 8 isoform X6 [Leopardus geoffroyi]|nr:caspase recruitment domain-containing protein 8 isoform X6 [Leopardus geoffroyi]XP_045296694.1 caspase recruitment domain-containing protein 8 isoform X6 [Leopardus geoffroyi]XP_045296695.1 caspase recruitment domain-containing protein 8 isoform X6 [Leopardus geoffroyi]